jgi:hypothetical protein
MKTFAKPWLVVVLLVAAIAIAACGGDDDEASAVCTTSTDCAIGETFESDGGELAVYSFESPVEAEDDSVQPDAGTAFALIDVEGCLSEQREGVVTLHVAQFALELSDGSELVPAQTAEPVREPELTGDVGVQEGECERGYIAFHVPADAAPAAVTYEGVGDAEASEEFGGLAVVRWTIEE